MRRLLVGLVVMPLAIAAVSAAEPDAEGRPLAWSVLAPLPDDRGVAGAFAGVSGGDQDDGALVVAGGANFPSRPPWEGGAKTWHAAAYVLPSPGSGWLSATPLPRPLGYGVTASFGGRIWCVGGGDATEHVRSTVALAWDAVTKTLAVEIDALPPLPRAMALGGGVVAGGRLYVAGGQTSPSATTALGTFWSIDLAAADAERQWHEHPTWPGPERILPVLGTLDGQVYLVSGAELLPAAADGTSGGTRRFLTDAYAFDPRHETWRRIAPCPVPLVAAPGPAIPRGDSCLVFLPGDDGRLFFRQKELAGDHPGFAREIHVYDVRTDTWGRAERVPEAVRPVVATSTVSWRGGWVVPSGEVQPGVRSPQIVRLLPEPPPAPHGAR